MTRRAELGYFPLCTVAGCPKPRDPDWHIPWCGHGERGMHQHTPKRSLGGKEIVAFLCPACTDKVDSGPWGDGVFDIPGIGRVYRIWDLYNKIILERVILPLVGGEGVAAVPSLAESDGTPTTLEDNRGKAPPFPPSGVHLTPTSLEFTRDLNIEEWIAIGNDLALIHKAQRWWWGDWLAHGEHAYGEMYSQAMGESGLEYGSLANAVWVSRQIPSSRRRENLSWSIHREVAHLPPEEQDKHLDMAEQESLTVKGLRALVKPKALCVEHQWITKCRLCGQQLALPLENIASIPSEEN